MGFSTKKILEVLICPCLGVGGLAAGECPAGAIWQRVPRLYLQAADKDKRAHTRGIAVNVRDVCLSPKQIHVGLTSGSRWVR